MELKHIDIARLSVSALNMRGTKKSCDIANILPSVRARGVLVPLIVRERIAGEVGAGEGGGALPTYEILGGARRYHAALALAEEGAGIEDLPCAVLEAGDDAAALEASLIENIARLDPDEMTRCETFRCRANPRAIDNGRTMMTALLDRKDTRIHAGALAARAGEVCRTPRLGYDARERLDQSVDGKQPWSQHQHIAWLMHEWH
jgi:hypothetical protein